MSTEATRRRHARETASLAGRIAGGVSRETIRQAERVLEACQALRATGDPDLGRLADRWEAMLRNGSRSVGWLYRSIRDDDRKALYVRIPEPAWDALDEAAQRTGKTKAELVAYAILQVFGISKGP